MMMLSVLTALVLSQAQVGQPLLSSPAPHGPSNATVDVIYPPGCVDAGAPNYYCPNLIVDAGPITTSIGGTWDCSFKSLPNQNLTFDGGWTACGVTFQNINASNVGGEYLDGGLSFFHPTGSYINTTRTLPAAVLNLNQLPGLNDLTTTTPLRVWGQAQCNTQANYDGAYFSIEAPFSSGAANATWTSDGPGYDNGIVWHLDSNFNGTRVFEHEYSGPPYTTTNTVSTLTQTQGVAGYLIYGQGTYTGNLAAQVGNNLLTVAQGYPSGGFNDLSFANPGFVPFAQGIDLLIGASGSSTNLLCVIQEVRVDWGLYAIQ